MTAVLSTADRSPRTAEQSPAPAANSAVDRRGSLVVFSDDWGRHPSSCQHLVRHLTNDYEVLWVNTIGTRGPKLDLATLRRAAGKLLKRRPTPTGGAYESASHVHVKNPLMWPWFRRPIDRRLNRRLLLRALRGPVAQLPRPVIGVSTIPLVADLVGPLAVDGWVYYCVDDLASWPGLESGPLQSMELELLASVDEVVSVSDYLQRRLRDRGRESTLISHGVDLERWNSRAAAADAVCPSLKSAQRPLVVFWGLIDERLDADWLLALANAMPRGSIALVGPVVVHDHRLSRHPRIGFHGAMKFEDLPQLAAQAAALIMPYRQIPATAAMQPLKLKEYLATGLPCIVRRLPATEPWQDCADVASTSDEFASLVLSRLEGGLPPAQRAARARLHGESWLAKAQQFNDVLRQVAARRTPTH
jgi:glycosyltransferase involved in cell wall biosynthesis